MTRTTKLESFVKSRISRAVVAATTVLTAAILAFGGLSPVGAQATGTYDCGTYGGGNYDQTDCTDPAPSTGGSTSAGGSTSTGGSTGSGSSSSSGSTSGGSSSGSTGSTSTGSSSAGTTILLNDFAEFTATTGKSLDFKQGAVFYFNLKGEKHTITVKSADTNTLVVTIASTPTDVSVPMGQTVNYDVDKDGTPDLAITYSTFASDSATASAVFRSLATTSTSTGTTTTGSDTQNSTGGTTLPATGTTNLWWIWLFPIAIGVALLVWAVIALKRRKAAANNGGGTFNGPTF